MRPRSLHVDRFARRSREAGRGLRHLGEAGFTLLELSVVVFIISLIVALAVPALKKIQTEARSTAVANDLRVFAGALQTYVHERGDWPPGNSEPGVLPAGMEGYLRETNWSRTTPIGGRYTWAPNTLQQGERYRAAIVLSSVADSAVTTDKNQLIDLDRKLDDGSLDTGNFRLGYRNFPVFVLEH
jgi:prepilin-type N-terminal cleavage/methylation domain-containing protein